MNEELLSQLNDSDPKVRRSATKELRIIVEPPVREALGHKLSDSDEIVRRNVVLGLGNWDDEDTVNAVSPLLTDSSFDVRCAAAEVLSRLNCQAERIRDELRRHYRKLPYSSHKHSAERREKDLVYRVLLKIDPEIDAWLREQSVQASGQAYLGKIEDMKHRIDASLILEKQASVCL